MRQTVRKIRSTIDQTGLTPQEVTSVLNIIPPFIENSIFWTLSSSPAKGRVARVEYQGFVEVIREGEEILVGPINDGQSGVIIWLRIEVHANDLYIITGTFLT